MKGIRRKRTAGVKKMRRASWTLEKVPFPSAGKGAFAMAG